MATTHYIIDINDEKIEIINRENKKSMLITVHESAFSAVVNNGLLICGLSGHYSSSPNIIVVDLKQGKIIDQYKTNGLLHHEHPVYGIKENCGTIVSVVAKNNLVFMSHESGKVVAVNLTTHTHQVLENDFARHWPYLSLSENQLLIRSDGNDYVKPYICIWDIDKMERLKKIDFNKLNGCLWDKGNLLVSTENSLIQYDFKVLHQNGEILANGSPGQLDQENEINNICAQM